MPGITDQQFYAAMNELREKLERKIDARANDLERKLDEHADEDRKVADRVASLEQTRKDDGERANRRMTITAGVMAAVVTAAWKFLDHVWK